MPRHDAIIISTSRAGPSLAHRLAGAGMRVAVPEGHRFGGACINTGCTRRSLLGALILGVGGDQVAQSVVALM